MILVRETIFLVLTQATLSYGWPPSNYSKLAATYGIGSLNDEVDWSKHPCKRDCKDDEPSMICRYGFTVEHYATMSKACYDCPFNTTDCYRPHCLPGDGTARSVIVVNRLLPGLNIEVCKNDRIIVDVENMLDLESTSIHWHGLHQRDTPFMDGVPMISQCPIARGDIFRYEFLADNAGTHWWHSHSSFQRTWGVFGGLIVRNPPSINLVGHLYDTDEHLIVLNEWNARSLRETVLNRHYAGSDITKSHSIFINGLGRYDGNNQSTLIPRPVFYVKMGAKHRFRLINAASRECSFTIMVDQHPMLVISADGSDVKPIEVDAIRSIPGERYDFVIDANRKVDNYWIRVSGGSVNCELKHQEAILRYKGAPDIEPIEPTSSITGSESDQRLLNPANQGSETNGAMCISCSLVSLEPDDSKLISTPQSQFYVNLDSFALDNPKDYRKNLYDTHQVPLTSVLAQMNHFSFKEPDFPLQTQPELIKADQLCNVTEVKCMREQCACQYVHQMKLNSTVEIIFVSEATHRQYKTVDIELPHGMHLHGFNYRVVAMEKLGLRTSVEKVRALDQAGKIHRKLKGAPKKDVIDVPSGGYTVVRFRADNPGYWFFHCHYESHMYEGMAMVIKVGEHKDFPPVPKHFPKCHYRTPMVGNHRYEQLA